MQALRRPVRAWRVTSMQRAGPRVGLYGRLVLAKLWIVCISQLITLFALVAWQLATSRSDLLERLQGEADRLARDLTAAVSTGDRAAAAKSLSRLELTPGIVSAAVYAADGTLLAGHGRPGALPPSLPVPALTHALAWHRVTLQRPLDGSAGHLLLQGSLWPAYRRALWFALVAGVVMAASFALAWALTAKHRRRLYRAERGLRRLAHYDSLTGLPNRKLFLRQFKLALAQHPTPRRSIAVMFVDLDNFKIINDTLGHEVGDRLLREVGRRLAQVAGANTQIGRLGGDEFSIVQLDSDRDTAARLAEDILQALTSPMQLLDHLVYVGASIGIALYPQDGTDASTLLKRADAAMYQAKENGKNGYQFFTPQMHLKALQHFAFEMSLRRAIERDELALYYQPQVEVESRRIVGVEALLRWKSAEFGTFSSGDFIAIAEQSGLINQLGAWALEAACRQARAWAAAGLDGLTVSVNLSVRQLHTSDIARLVRETLEKTGLDPRLLELEITETVLMKQNAEVMDKLKALTDLGVRLAIDDFGTGYSSLAYLRRLPINRLKIDRSFVRDSHLTPDDAAITTAIIAMAHKLGIEVTAEGVENEEQLTLLKQAGCHVVQGYYFGSPLPADELETLVRRLRASAAPEP